MVTSGCDGGPGLERAMKAGSVPKGQIEDGASMRTRGTPIPMPLRVRKIPELSSRATPSRPALVKTNA